MISQSQSRLTEIFDDSTDPTLRSMLEDFSQGPEIHHPSKFWDYLVALNLKQLQDAGISNFKRTINQNYFNWILEGLTDQTLNLRSMLGYRESLMAKVKALSAKSVSSKPPEWSDSQWTGYKEFLLLL